MDHTLAHHVEILVHDGIVYLLYPRSRVVRCSVYEEERRSRRVDVWRLLASGGSFETDIDGGVGACRDRVEHLGALWSGQRCTWAYSAAASSSPRAS